jgi:hypothetical protein
MVGEGGRVTHPHPDKRHVMTVYRRHILGSKRKWGTARGLIHYRALLAEYLACKRAVLEAETKP